MTQLFRRLFALPLINVPTQSIWIFLGLVSWTVPLGNYVWLGTRYFEDWRIFLTASTSAYLICLFLLVGQTAIIRSITNRYPEVSQTPKRMVLEFPVFFFLTLVTEFSSFYLYQAIPFFNFYPTPSAQITIFWIGLGSNIISLCMYELYYTLTKWRENSLQAEAYKREALLNQLDVLKNQVNPHFLFNSLNSLSSLISEEPKQAEQFVDELAKVYRYLLQTNEGNLTTLDKELFFIESYYYLLKTRHQQGVRLTIDVTPEYRTQFLPPLTLQLLVENAVKHNRVQATQPLQITIDTTPEGWLRVQNNLQLKSVRMASNQVGLSNITTKYRLLNQPEPIITDTNGHFIVRLPLLPESNSRLVLS
ncbi:sensor histidine kinase [Spirosoma validum]|uniref:Histidine kinase n=1 Tax=Spirosoma validum TaxID=2771355 RepID=A0A927B3K3_9BACT|nr:histidine kinase [Spirosoma validum]MBD2754984.1 histidine kinase [Spirosoma validum]